MLCIPKKDGAIRTVDDMRELNKCVLRRVYPLPRLLDMIRRHHGWNYVTVLDLTSEGLGIASAIPEQNY